ncbi:hypothetical protein GFJ94_11435 [Flavobacterium sp. LMO8]|uniref:hypothetical protein n=1 Tax=Flavobacterium sp. LMO8 TaxID=2654244 RepID=UPI001290E3EC|nr:hypothetical protein [Flavobacterium sp. LMO8]MQP25675.1 hypothetical protein [Flavobacterium sp. LMO8]
MKNKFKFLIASISIAMLFLSSCEKEIYGEATRKQIERNDFVINRKSFNQLNTETKFNSAYKKINSEIQNKKLSSKMVMEEMYNFTIDSTQINEVLTEKYTSYSFGIIRDTINPNFYENLFIEIDSSDAPQASILKFNINPNTKELISITSKLIQYNISQTGKIYYTPPCSYVTVTTETPCVCAGHWPGECGGCSEGPPTSSTQTYLVCREDAGGSGDTWTNTSSENGGGGSGGTSISAPRVLTPKEQRIKNFMLQLTPEQKNCLNSQDENIQGELMSFLENEMDIDGLISSETSYSAEDIANAEAALQTLCNGGDVDFDNKVMLDSTFVNNQKVMCIYTKMRTINAFNKALEPFEGASSKAFIKLKTDILDDADRAFTTEPDSNNIIEITLNSCPTCQNGINYQPNTMIAQTIIHEVLHAEFFRRIIVAINNGSYIHDYDTIVNALENSQYSQLAEYIRTTEDWSHNYMAENFRRAIARVTQQYDTGIAVSGIPDAFYTNLAWRGLNNADVNAWVNLSPTAQIDINTAISNFVSSNSNQLCP